MNDAELTLVLKLRDEATKQMSGATKGMAALGAAAAAAVAVIGVKAVSAFKDFQGSMNQVKAVSGATARRDVAPQGSCA